MGQAFLLVEHILPITEKNATLEKCCIGLEWIESNKQLFAENRCKMDKSWVELETNVNSRCEHFPCHSNILEHGSALSLAGWFVPFVILLAAIGLLTRASIRQKFQKWLFDKFRRPAGVSSSTAPVSCLNV